MSAARDPASLSQSALVALLIYEPETGLFIWRARSGRAREIAAFNRRCANKAAGTVSPYGYRVICIQGRCVMAHRLAYLYMTGAFPCGEVDHANGVRDDNRWSNLRVTSALQNNRNVARYRNNKSGVIGVFWSKKNGRWQAMIGVGGRQKHLGYFDSIREAAEARRRAETLLGYAKHHGRERNPNYVS